MNEELVVDIGPDGRMIKFVKSTLYKTKGKGPISGKVLDAKIAQDLKEV
jgi:hypothetical protein